MTTKIVINRCYGGFSISRAACEELGKEWDGYGFLYDLDQRADPALVACVEKLGEAASGALARLVVVEIPDDVEWEISEYDGVETVAEVHRTWP
jgi:hypothetical protein